MRHGNEMIDATATESATTRMILALDLGKFRSLACVFDADSREHRFETIATTPSTVHDLLVDAAPQLLEIEKEVTSMNHPINRQPPAENARCPFNVFPAET